MRMTYDDMVRMGLPPTYAGINQDPAVYGELAGGIFGGANTFPAYASEYSRMVNTPLYNTSRQQLTYLASRGVGRELGLIGSIAGRDARTLGEQMARYGSSPTGMMIGEQLFRQPTVQAMTGGDIYAMHDMLYGQRYNLARKPGTYNIHPGNIPQQAAIAEHAATFNNMLNMAISGNAQGEIGLLPTNRQFTRGFARQDIGYLAGTMSERGAPMMRGMDISPRLKVGAVGDMVRTMEALGDLTGDRNMDTLVDSLDKLTNKRWPRLNPADLTRAIREIGATAETLSVSGDMMLRTMEQMATVQRGLGYKGSSIDVTRKMATQAIILSQNTGMDLGEATAKVGSLAGMAGVSPRGHATAIMEWAAERNMVSPDTLARARASINASPRVQRAAMDALYEEAGIGQAMGRRMERDPRIMQGLIYPTMSEGAQLRTYEQNAVGQRAEYMDFSQRYVNKKLNRMSGEIGRLTGVGNIPQAQVANTKFNATQDYFVNILNDPKASPEDKAIARQKLSLIQDVYRGAGGGTKGFGAVQRAISGDEQLRGYMGDITDVQTRAVSNMLLDAGGRMGGDAALRGQLREAARVISDPGQARRIREAQGMLSRADAAGRRGNAGEQARLTTEAQSILGSVMGGATESQRTEIVGGGQRAERKIKDMQWATSSAQALQQQQAEAARVGMDPGQVLRANQAVYAAIKAYMARPSPDTRRNAMAAIEGSQLPPSAKAAAIRAMQAGGTQLMDYAETTRRIQGVGEGSDIAFEMSKGAYGYSKVLSGLGDAQLAMRGMDKRVGQLAGAQQYTADVKAAESERAMKGTIAAIEQAKSPEEKLKALTDYMTKGPGRDTTRAAASAAMKIVGELVLKDHRGNIVGSGVVDAVGGGQ